MRLELMRYKPSGVKLPTFSFFVIRKMVSNFDGLVIIHFFLIGTTSSGGLNL